MSHHAADSSSSDSEYLDGGEEYRDDLLPGEDTRMFDEEDGHKAASSYRKFIQNKTNKSKLMMREHVIQRKAEARRERAKKLVSQGDYVPVQRAGGDTEEKRSRRIDHIRQQRRNWRPRPQTINNMMGFGDDPNEEDKTDVPFAARSGDEEEEPEAGANGEDIENGGDVANEEAALGGGLEKGENDPGQDGGTGGGTDPSDPTATRPRFNSSSEPDVPEISDVHPVAEQEEAAGEDKKIHEGEEDEPLLAPKPQEDQKHLDESRGCCTPSCIIS